MIISFIKVLVYSFEPYGESKENISEKIVKKTKNRKNLVKIIFPVGSNEEIFLKAIKENKPDAINIFV